MKLIVNKIRLHDRAHRQRFEDWVQNADYVACSYLPSVQGFSVQLVDSDNNFDYFEIITVTSQEAFEEDTRSRKTF